MTTKTCVRCAKQRSIRVTLPDGPVCSSCFENGANTHGTCTRCGDQRMLLGRASTGSPLCVDCAGISTSFRCYRCNTEGHIFRNSTCVRCCLRDDLTHLLTPVGETEIRVELQQFVDAIVAQRRPQSAMIWLRNNNVRTVLTELGTGNIALTHETLDRRCEHVKTVGHIRELLVATGALPPRDTRLHRLETHIDTRLAEIDSASERAVVKSYITWKRLRRLRSLAANGKSTEAGIRYARQELTVIVTLLGWLNDHDSSLADCDQAKLDQWITTGPSTRRRCATFVTWAVERRHIAHPCQVPHTDRTTLRSLSEEERITLLRRLLDPTPDAQLAIRLAATLVVLYGARLDTIRHLTLDDIGNDGDDTTVRLADDPAIVPPRVADMLTAQMQHRANTHTAANPECRWLFPGQTARRPIAYNQLLDRIYELDTGVRLTRNAALRELVLTIPTPVLTTILGYTANTLDRHARHSGAPWIAYATGAG